MPMSTRVYNPNKKRIYDMKEAPTSVGAINRGIVIDNEDPKQMGRIKARIGGLHDGISDEDLPWAYPSLPYASYNSGSFIIPEIGNTVWIVFEDGDSNYPVWLGCVYSSETTKSRSLKNAGQIRNTVAGDNDSPKEGRGLTSKVVYQSPSGDILYMDESSNEDYIVLRDRQGDLFAMTSSGTNISVGNVKIKVLRSGSVLLSNESGSVLIDKNGQIKINNSEASIRMNDNGVEIVYGGSKFYIKDDHIEANCNGTYMKVGVDNFDMKKGSSRILGNGSAVLASDGKATLRLASGIADLQATTVNIQGSFINLTDSKGAIDLRDYEKEGH